jgi:hypothetical protein
MTLTWTWVWIWIWTISHHTILLYQKVVLQALLVLVIYLNSLPFNAYKTIILINIPRMKNDLAKQQNQLKKWGQVNSKIKIKRLTMMKPMKMMMTKK